MLWALRNHHYRIALMMGIALAWFPMTMALIAAVYWIDSRLQVVAEATVEVIAVQRDGTVQIAGRMNKVRGCEFTGLVSRRSDGAVAPVRYTGPKFTRPLGVQSYGPLIVEARPGDEVTLISQHACHAFWPHAEVLLQFRVPQ